MPLCPCQFPALLLAITSMSVLSNMRRVCTRIYHSSGLFLLFSCARPHLLRCRSTFRRISQDTNKFVRFANGLMNESNSLVASVMEKLPEVRTVQLQMRDPAQWGAMTEAQRNEVEER